MEGLDPNSIDQSSTFGQITMLIAVLGIFLSAIAPLFPKRGGKTKAELIQEMFDNEKRNAIIIREINTNLSEWQIVARSLIRILKNEVADLGGEIPERAEILDDRLDEIDEREVNFNDE